MRDEASLGGGTPGGGAAKPTLEHRLEAMFEALQNCPIPKRLEDLVAALEAQPSCDTRDS